MTGRRNRAAPIVGLVVAWLVLICCLVLFGYIRAAQSHNWYDSWCCDQRDCAPVPAGTTITPAPSGYMVAVPGREPRLFLQSAVRPSQDGEIHICIYRGEARCLYMPAGA